jgi:hypothetical protein
MILGKDEVAQKYWYLGDTSYLSIFTKISSFKAWFVASILGFKSG